MPYLCINAKPISGNYNIAIGELNEGKVYEGYVDHLGVDTNYTIAPCLVIPSISDDYGYDLRRFIETSGIDETTLVTEEFEEKHCVPVNR